MLEIKNLSVCGKQQIPLLRNISFTLEQGQCLGLTGASGSGKTTLLKSVMGVLDDAVLTLLENYHTHYGCSYLLITHDRQAAYRISDHILVMEKGKIIQHGRRRVKPLSE